MAVYDDQRTEIDPLEEAYNLPSAGSGNLPGSHPDQDADIKSLEEGYASPSASDKDLPDGHPDKSKSNDYTPKNVEDQVRDGYLRAKEQDAADGSGEPESKASFYNGARGVNKERRQALKNTSKRNKMIIAAGGGVLTIGIGLLMSFGNFFAVFKLDHILQNIDAKSFSRFNASFSNRSDQYFKAYLKMRLNEINNPDGSHDTLLFKADKVDTDRPIRDWYRTLRTGNFEKELQAKTGIAFSAGSIRNADGTTTLKPVQLMFNNEVIDTLDPESSGLSQDTITKLKSGKLDTAALNDLNKLGDKADNIVTKNFFNDNRTARKAVKEAVKDETHFWNVLKRRHIRKDIMNKTGILSWRIFETTRDNYINKKIKIQQKIISKILPNNKAGFWANCILGSGPCKKNGDQNAPSNQSGADALGEPSPENKSDPVDDLDNATTDPKTGDITASTVDDAANVADDVAKTVENSAANELSDTVAKEANQEGLTIVEKEATSGVSPIITATQIWSWLQKLAKISNNIVGNVFGKLVSNARLAQLAAAYATFNIALDQGKTGQLSADEFGQLMETLNDVGQSEGWLNMNNPTAGNSVSAEATTAETNVSKTEYCKMNVKEQKLNKIHYFCSSPNGDSNGSKLKEQYENSVVCTLICPIAEVVNGIKSNPVTNFLSGVLNFIGSLSGRIMSALHIDDLFKAILDSTGISDSIGKLISYGMVKIMAFLGAGPIWDGTGNSGAVNFLMAGSAATAEASTRSSGGVASTPKTLAYSNQLAASYEKAQKDSQSLFDRYASTSNPQSMFSTALFSVTSFNISTSLSHLFGWFGTIPKTLGSLANGNAFATTSDFNVAKWAGVDTYDIPPACQGTNLDPLDPDYLTKAVGVVDDSPSADKARSVITAIRPSITYANETDSAQFWKIVYDEIKKEEIPETNKDGTVNNTQEGVASAIYNCALFDQRVMSGLGYTSGYTNDGGLNSGDDAGTNNASGTSPSTGIPEDLCSGYYTIANAHGGTVPLDSNGWPINATLKTYGETVSSVCGERKKECLSGNMPYSQKGLCEAFKFYKTFYGANYTSSTGQNDDTKTHEWYGIEAKGNAEHNPAGWVANWKSGLNPNNLLACTGVTTLSIYYAYDPTYTSQIYKGDRFKRLTSIYDIQPGDYIDNRIPGVIGHNVIAASKYENGRLVVFNATGFGKTAQFSVYSSTQIKEQGWDKAEYLRWNRAEP